MCTYADAVGAVVLIAVAVFALAESDDDARNVSANAVAVVQVLCKKILTSDYAVAVGAGVVISDAACVFGVCCCCRYWCCWCMLLL